MEPEPAALVEVGFALVVARRATVVLSSFLEVTPVFVVPSPWTRVTCGSLLLATITAAPTPMTTAEASADSPTDSATVGHATDLPDFSCCSSLASS